MIIALLIAVLFLLIAAVMFALLLKRRRMHRWLPAYIAGTPRRGRPRDDEPVHVILCIADHYEPKWGKPSPEVARARVETWLRDYPKNLGRFRDSDGQPPRYSFFFPYDEYETEHVDMLGELCRRGYGEVEVHLHHDHDTPEGLAEKLNAFREILVERHGMLSRHRTTGAIGYAFIHGNWALCNSKQGRWCGVNDELTVLRETGCYADLTFPSAPDLSQPPMINCLYYAKDGQKRPAAQNQGVRVGHGNPPDDSLLLITGPLLLDWQDRKWGLLPRVENACLQASQPPSGARLENWLRARIQVPNRPDWFFVKLHAHGAPEESHEALLGKPMIQFHEALAQRARENSNFHYHYVTAREMYNLIKAAEAGWKGSVAEARDFVFVSNIISEKKETQLDFNSSGVANEWVADRLR